MPASCAMSGYIGRTGTRGLGALSKGINLDIAYTSLKTDSRLSSYPYPFNQPFANFSTKVRSVIMTLGIRINNR